jgi:negative regulator of sigma E activity
MENLKSYLDGELDIAQQAEVETHLRNDAELQKTVEEFSAISSTLKTADCGEPYGFEKLEEKLKAAPKASIYEKKKIWRLATYWSASMACLALAATFVRSGSGSSADAMAGVSIKSSSMSDVAAPSGGVPSNQPSEMQDKSADLQQRKAKFGDGMSAGESEASKPAQYRLKTLE